MAHAPYLFPKPWWLKRKKMANFTHKSNASYLHNLFTKWLHETFI